MPGESDDLARFLGVNTIEVFASKDVSLLETK